jgi:hypothetical protein
MFGRLATDRIKTAEAALNEGRLDQAADLLTAVDAASLQKASRLAESVVSALLQRGQEHMLSRRFQLALVDFDKAARCGIMDHRVNDWRQRARAAIHEDDVLREAQAKALKGSKQLLNDGQITQARHALEQAPQNDVAKQKLSDGIDKQHQQAAQAVASARTAVEDGLWELAIEKLAMATKLHRQSPGLDALMNQAIAGLTRMMREAFTHGQLHMARRQSAILAGNLDRAGGSADMNEALKLTERAARAIHEDRFSEAEVLLGRLAGMKLGADWIDDARKHLQSVQEHRQALLEGPLGLMSGAAVPQGLTLVPNAAPKTLVSNNPAPPPVIKSFQESGIRIENGHIPRRFALRIDGVGTFLVLRGDRLSIGRSGASARADLELISDLSERHAEIIRAGEDFFIASGGGVELAGRPVEHALLQDGDRIRLGSRVKMKFHRPSGKSVTGVLELGDGVRSTCECRRVILWSGTLLLGNTRDCHIPLPYGLNGAVMMDRGGQLWMKPLSAGEQARPVVMGGTIVMGELRMSITNLDA